MLTLRQIEAFKAVIDAGTVVRAADMMRRSQPAVSRLLTDLETEVGYRLFDRRKGKLTPRDEARELYVEIDRCFIGLQRIAEVAERIGRNKTTHLRIAALPILTFGPLPAVVARFLDERPDVFVSLEARTQRQILDGLAHNQHDVGLATLPIDDPEIGVRQLMSMELACLVPANHPLSVLDAITPQDLHGQRCILAADRTPMRLKIGQLLDDAGVRPDFRVEVTTAHTAVALAVQGVGICMGWRIMHDDAVSQGIHVIPFRPRLQVDVAALSPASRPLDGTAAEFVDAYADATATWQSTGL